MNRKNEFPINSDFKSKYQHTFLQISPSEATEERIVAMAGTKGRKSVRRVVAIMAAVIAFLVCATLVAEAATDGAVSKGISQAASSAADKIKKEIQIIENGNKVVIEADIHKKIGDDGKEHYVVEIDDGDRGVMFEIAADGKDVPTGNDYQIEYRHSENFE